MIAKLREERMYPCTKTVKRWENKSSSLGHVRPCRRTRNVRASVFHDHNLFILALYRLAYQKAIASEINAFLYKANYGSFDFRFYSASQITVAKQRIGLTRKRGSTTAYQALLSINKKRDGCFGTSPIHLESQIFVVKT